MKTSISNIHSPVIFMLVGNRSTQLVALYLCIYVCHSVMKGVRRPNILELPVSVYIFLKKIFFVYIDLLLFIYLFRYKCVYIYIKYLLWGFRSCAPRSRSCRHNDVADMPFFSWLFEVMSTYGIRGKGRSHFSYEYLLPVREIRNEKSLPDEPM